MNRFKNSINILTILSFGGFGRAWVYENYKKDDAIEVLLSKMNKKSKEHITQSEFNDHRSRVIDDISLLGDSMDGVISFVDDGFPPIRGRGVNGSDFPVVLFYKGDISLLYSNRKTIAVIGLLEPTEQIQIVEERVVGMLVKRGAVIVSGLANGCDSIAHIQTLESGGKTVAILPSTLSNILPISNEILADEIVENGGLLITEYYKEVKSQKELYGRYPERDRLQAIFADCVVLSASYAKEDAGDSGSRYAMETAKKYGIRRAVMYNPIVNKEDAMFNLNRQICSGDNSVIVINKHTILDAIDKVMGKSGEKIENKNLQTKISF